MPSAATLRRAWLHPRKTYARPLLGQRPLLGPLAVVEASAFRPGVRFDLLDDRGNRLGWGRVTALGDIELFDAASNRLGNIRPTIRAFAQNGQGLTSKTAIQTLIRDHPDWDREQIKSAFRRRQKEAP